MPELYSAPSNSKPVSPQKHSQAQEPVVSEPKPQKEQVVIPVAPETIPIKESSQKVLHQNHLDVCQMLDRQPSRNPFSAFMVKPRNIKVEIQDENEEILLLLRRHLLTNLKWIIIALIMAIAPSILSVVPIISPLPVQFQLMTVVLWYLITLGYVIESFLSWYFNVYIVTDERVIDVDFLNLLYKNISAAKIENIEEISSQTTGAIRSLFNYGNVFIQTAGESPQIEFEAVPKPQQVAKFLNQLILEEEKEQLEGRIR